MCYLFNVFESIWFFTGFGNYIILIFYVWFNWAKLYVDMVSTSINSNSSRIPNLYVGSKLNYEQILNCAESYFAMTLWRSINYYFIIFFHKKLKIY